VLKVTSEKYDFYFIIIGAI